MEFKEKKNACIYVDYENILRRLRAYSVHPINDLDFFRKLASELMKKDINILDYVAYANFDDSDLSNKTQTQINRYGVRTVHTNNDGKTCSDLALAVDVVIDLYKNTNIDVFIIVSCDRDFISVMSAIKRENKKVIAILLKEGSNSIINFYANEYIYIDDMFEFEKEGISINSNNSGNTENELVYQGEVTDELKEKAILVSDYFYTSKFYSEYLENEEKKVALVGYASMLSKNVMKDKIQKDIITYFKVANKLEYIEIFEYENKSYLRDGKNKNLLK